MLGARSVDQGLEDTGLLALQPLGERIDARPGVQRGRIRFGEPPCEIHIFLLRVLELRSQAENRGVGAHLGMLGGIGSRELLVADLLWDSLGARFVEVGHEIVERRHQLARLFTAGHQAQLLGFGSGDLAL